MKSRTTSKRLDRHKRLIRVAGPSAAMFAILALGACSSTMTDSNNNWERLYKYTKEALNGESPSVTLEQASAIPFATIGVRFGDNPEGMLVLATEESGHFIWTSSSHIAIETSNGRIVRTSGTGNDLSGLTFRAATASYAPGPNSRTMDFQDIGKFSIPVDCTDVEKGPVSLTILGQSIDTHQIDEICSSETISWQFVNSFWIDAEGFVWKSIQHVHPDAPAITITTLRPPG